MRCVFIFHDFMQISDLSYFDFLAAVEMERDRGSIDKLVRRMLNSDLIFFARELDQRQINIGSLCFFVFFAF